MKSQECSTTSLSAVPSMQSALATSDPRTLMYRSPLAEAIECPLEERASLLPVACQCSSVLACSESHNTLPRLSSSSKTPSQQSTGDSSVSFTGFSHTGVLSGATAAPEKSVGLVTSPATGTPAKAIPPCPRLGGKLGIRRYQSDGPGSPKSGTRCVKP